MDDWTINLSPGELPCSVCEFDVEPGFAIFAHPSWPGTWACLTCALKDVRRFLREHDLAERATKP